MKKTLLLIVVILVVKVLLTYLTTKYVMTLENVSVIYAELIKSGTVTAEALYEQMHSVLQVVGQVTAVVQTLLSIAFIALVVFGGFYLVQKQPFLEVLKSSVVAQMAVLLAGVAQLVYFIYFNPPTSQIELSVMPFSLATLLSSADIAAWAFPALNTANIFEVLYVLLFAYSLSKNVKLSFGTCCKVVLCSYGLMTLLLVVFNTISMLYVTQ